MKNLLNFFLFILFLLSDTVSARIITDGTTGSNTSLSGPNYKVTSDFGKISGNNLFHSFSEFNIYTNESATFSGPSNILNIISRVTGNKSSYIDGLLKSEIYGADFYFINPNGVMFGKNASVDVSGSFYVSSADYIKLGDNGRFDALNPEKTSLTVASPEAFGFLGNNIGKISIQGNYISVDSGKEINIFSENLKLEDAVLDAPSGKVNLISAGSQGEIKKDNADNEWKPIGFSQMGDIFISRTGERTDFQTYYNIYDIDVTALSKSSLPGGSINLYGKNIGLENVTITSLTPESVIAKGKGGNINVLADNLAFFNGAKILTKTYSYSDSGDININLNGKLTFSGETSDGFSSVLNSITYYNGNAGNINVNSGNISIIDGGQIGSFSYGDGTSGNININNKGSIELRGQNSRGNKSGIYSNIFSSGDGSNVNILTPFLYMEQAYIQSSNGKDSLGNTGNININSENISVYDGAQISSSTFGSGKSGDVKIINKERIIISGEDIEGYNSGVYATTHSDGKGGMLNIITGTINVLDGANISVTSYNTGSAGDINIDAEVLYISGTDIKGYNSGVYANTFSSGKGGGLNINASEIKLTEGYIEASAYKGSTGDSGNINITADNIYLNEGAAISGSTKGSGNAGNLDIDVSGKVIIVGNSDDAKKSGIYVETWDKGRGGLLKVSSNDFELVDNAEISSSAFGEGDAGGIIAEAKGKISIEGFASGFFSNTFGKGDSGILSISASELFMSEGVIEASASGNASGNAGNIDIRAGKINLIENSKISANTKSSGSAGDLNIIASEINLNLSSIEASARSGSAGNAGSIKINADKITLDNAGYITGSTFGDGKGGNININVKDTLSILYRDKDDYSSGIFANTYSKGNAGKISINASNFIITDGIVEAVSDEDSKGNAGDIDIVAGNISMSQGGKISASTKSSGNAGSIHINADNINLTDGAKILNNTTGAGNAGDIDINVSGKIYIDGQTNRSINSGIYVETDGTGKGGKLTINSANIELFNGAQISSSSFGDGHAGAVKIEVKDDFTIFGNDQDGYSAGIFSNTFLNGDGGLLWITVNKLSIFDGLIQASSSKDSTGDAGKIIIDANKINLFDGAEVSASTWGSGSAGDIKIAVNDMLYLSGENEEGFNSGIHASTNSDGKGGLINIEANKISLEYGGVISSSARGSGSAGDININSGKIIIEGEDKQGYSSGVFATSNNTGDSGSINIKSDKLKVSDSGVISVYSANEGKAGNIYLDVSDDLYIEKAGLISAEARFSSGGDISIKSANIRLIDYAEISSTVFGGEGGGGNVNISADSIVVLEGSSITAKADQGKGGNILLNTLVFLKDGELNNVLNASSNVIGNDGSVKVNSPELDISGSIVVLPGFFLDISSLIMNPCGLRSREDMSSLVVRDCNKLNFIPFDI